MSVDAACGADGRGREAAYGEVAMRAFVSGAAASANQEAWAYLLDLHMPTFPPFSGSPLDWAGASWASGKVRHREQNPLAPSVQAYAWGEAYPGRGFLQHKVIASMGTALLGNRGTFQATGKPGRWVARERSGIDSLKQD